LHFQESLLAVVHTSSHHILRTHGYVILGEFWDTQSAVKLFDIFTYFIDVALTWVIHKESSLDRLFLRKYPTWFSAISEPVVYSPAGTFESRWRLSGIFYLLK
jgi:hypothetical protein